MPAPVLVLLHSPLVGPLTWQAVAARLTAAGRQAVPASPVRPGSPDLAGVPGSSLVLVGHSGAGPLLPGLAASLGDRVAGLIYVDAQLPYPGKSWWVTELITHHLAMPTDADAVAEAILKLDGELRP